MRATPLARTARRRHKLEPPLIAGDGTIDAANAVVGRRIAARLNASRKDTDEPPVAAGDVSGLAALDAVLHRVVERERAAGRADLGQVTGKVAEALGPAALEKVSDAWREEFDERSTAPPPDLVAELLVLSALNENPATGAVRELVDDRPLRDASPYAELVGLAEDELGGRGTAPDPIVRDRQGRRQGRSAAGERATADGDNDAGDGQEESRPLSLPARLREPFARAPSSLAAQLRWVREHWPDVLADDPLLDNRIALALDVLAEEARALELRGTAAGGAFGGPRPAEAPSYGALEGEAEAFSEDTEWMPRVVLLAKSSHVWLEQLARAYGRPVGTLGDVPDEELDRLVGLGVTGLWLIGLWQRSRASAEIKRRRGDEDAVASAYSIDEYRIADDLGGEAAFGSLRERASARGIRIAADMVPNHMGLDSRWVIEHPTRFISTAESPFPAYSFTGPDLSADPRVELTIEDHYWDATDAAVVFRRRDRSSGETRFIYHGNDGTSFPWNDTAQLDFLQEEVREVVIQTILDVARRAPILRFDAAMVLARRHIRRLWYPAPGEGGAIPSRAEHAMSTAEFDLAMPREFWRDVVDRVAAEAPGTLLLAEAFWLLEGYFVRTLGMHRVYNSAFMHMLRDEDNAGYRKVIKDTLEFDPGVLGRFVNFLTNPDERPAAEQFGTGDKAFAAMTLLATMPGLPMLGHGQVEGYRERYGMEFRRARWDEPVDQGHADRFGREIVPLLRRRSAFAGSDQFRLYDALAEDGSLVEDVFAYSNQSDGALTLVVVHNRGGDVKVRLDRSTARKVHGAGRLVTTRLADDLEIPRDEDVNIRFRDERSGWEVVESARDLRRWGLQIGLRGYEALVLEVAIAIPAIDAAEDPEPEERAGDDLDEETPDGVLRRRHGPSPAIWWFVDLASEIRSRAPRLGGVRLVAVDGPGGSGKSDLARRLARALGGAPVVHTDDFASSDELTEWWPRLETEVLEPLARGEVAHYPEIDPKRRRLGERREVPPAEIVILEGVSSARTAVADRLSYTIWVETPREQRLARGVERDGEAMRTQWETWMAAEEAFYEKDRVRERADLVIAGDSSISHDPEDQLVVVR